jgi:hypothetical protein
MMEAMVILSLVSVRVPPRRILSAVVLAVVLLRSALLVGVLPCARAHEHVSHAPHSVRQFVTPEQPTPISCEHEESPGSPRPCSTMLLCAAASTPLHGERPATAALREHEVVRAAEASSLKAGPSFPPEPPPPRA